MFLPCHSEPVRRLAWESSYTTFRAKIATAVCALPRNDEGGRGAPPRNDEGGAANCLAMTKGGRGKLLCNDEGGHGAPPGNNEGDVRTMTNSKPFGPYRTILPEYYSKYFQKFQMFFADFPTHWEMAATTLVIFRGFDR